MEEVGEAITLPRIEDAGALRGKRVLLRASLNVPIKNGVVHDDFRLRRLLETVEYLRREGARTVLLGHIGRDPNDSLYAVCEALRKHVPIDLVSDVVGERAHEAIGALQDGAALMLENVRRHSGERDNDTAFAKQLAELGDVYVNEAFAASHRSHASIVGVPALMPHYAGIVFREEVKALRQALRPSTPALCVVGGAKFDTKRPLVEKLLDSYATVFIGGALANDFFKAAGFVVGRSTVSESVKSVAELAPHPRITLPVDLVVTHDGKTRISAIDDVKENERIVDAGPQTMELLHKRAREAAFVLWNGPLGLVEDGFDDATKALARTIAEIPAPAIVGGGDTVATIYALHLEEQFSFVSTGGGAMLQFLSDETLPGIEALRT